MNKNTGQLSSFSNQEEIEQFLKSSTIKIAEFITGVLGSDLSSYKLTTGNLVQAVIKRNILTQLEREIREYQEKGKIKEDYFATNKQQATLLDLLKFIDSDIPDEEVLNAMKSIFFTVISSDSGKKEEEIGYQLLQICKKLNSMDILVIRACYKIYKKNDPKYAKIHSYSEWEKIISRVIGYNLPELVSISSDKLEKLNLLSDKTYSDQSGIKKGENFRLKKLGIKLCEYISGWDEN
jgi:hypothetical protein